MATKLTKEQEQQVMTMIRRTWNVIAADYDHPEDKDLVVECVLDADYTTVYGQDKEADAWLRDQLTYEEQDAIAMKALFR